MNWEDITLKDYEELQNLYKTDKTRFANNAIEYLFNVKNADTTLSIGEYMKYLNEIKFFTTPMPKAKVKTEYLINDTQYTVNLNMAAFSAVQFQDFTTYQKQTNPSTVDMLSVVIVPTGHLYNDGYDLEKVKEDIETMNVSDAYAIVFFFATWLKQYVRILNGCLRRKLTKTLPMETAEQLKALREKMQEITDNMA